MSPVGLTKVIVDHFDKNPNQGKSPLLIDVKEDQAYRNLPDEDILDRDTFRKTINKFKGF